VTEPEHPAARAEALRRLESLVALLGYWTPLGEVAAVVDVDRPDNPARSRADVTAAIRIVLGTDSALDLKRDAA
jgi:hypothetical protein